MKQIGIVAICCVLGLAVCELFSSNNGVPLIYREDGSLVKKELSPCRWCNRDNVVEVDDMAFICKSCGYVSTVKIKTEGR